MKFAVGDIVVEKTDIRPHTSYNTQKVIAHLDGSLLLEHHGFAFDGEVHEEDFTRDSKPGSRSWREGLRRFQESELFTPEEAVEQLHKLEAAKSKLEDEFAAVTDEIVGKLEQAAKLVDEAATMVDKSGHSFEDLVRECGPLYKALEKGGWRHSTMRCKFG